VEIGAVQFFTDMKRESIGQPWATVIDDILVALMHVHIMGDTESEAGSMASGSLRQNMPASMPEFVVATSADLLEDHTWRHQGISF
jgi:hypothetical protein